MTIENGGEQPANDTVVADTTQGQQAADTSQAEIVEDQPPELDDDGNPIVSDETEELEWDGKKWVLPKDAAATLKPALLRQADYTKKTQEIAEARKAIDAERETFGKSREAREQHFQEAAKVFALNDRIGEVDQEIQKFAGINWATHNWESPEQYQQYRAHYDSLRDRKQALAEQRDTAARSWTQKEQEHTQQSNRERGERIAKVQAELPKLIEGFNTDLENKLRAYGNQQGISDKELAEWTLQNPKWAKVLHTAFKAEEAAKAAKTKQQFEQTQQAAPVTRVGGNSGSAMRKTTDSSGDALSADEWAKRETERVAKQRSAMGRR